jgi:hypothetical protein
MAKTTRSQVQKFKEAARSLQTDDSEKRFNERLTKIAKAKPEKPSQKSAKDRR